MDETRMMSRSRTMSVADVRKMRGRCRTRSQRCRVDIRAKPELEHQQHPQVMRVIAAAGLLIVKETPNDILPKQAALGEAGAKHVIGEHLAQLSAKPCAQRHGESLLPAMQVFRGNEIRN